MNFEPRTMTIASLIEKNRRIHKLMNLIEELQLDNEELDKHKLYLLTKEVYEKNYGKMDHKEYSIALDFVSLRQNHKENGITYER